MSPGLVLVLVMLFATTLANVACWFGVFSASSDEIRRTLRRRPLGVTTIRNLNVEADGWYQWWRRVVLAQMALVVVATGLVLVQFMR